MTAQAPAQTAAPQIARAALWMTGAIASFSAMAVAGRAVQIELNTFELMTWRSLIGLAIVLGVAALRGRMGAIRPRRMGLHLLRNIFHFSGQNLWFLAITMIPLAQVFALEFTAPLWVTLMAPFFLGERLTRVRAGAAALGFLGIVIVTRPDPGHLDPGMIAAAAAAVGFAGTAIFTKLLTRSEAVISILFWMTLMQSVFGVVCAWAYAGHLTLPDATTLPWLIVIGCAGLAAHFCLTSALRVAPATIVMPIDFVRLPVIAVVGMLLYGEPLDLLVFVGGAVILIANLVNIRAGAPVAIARTGVAPRT